MNFMAIGELFEVCVLIGFVGSILFLLYEEFKERKTYDADDSYLGGIYKIPKNGKYEISGCVVTGDKTKEFRQTVQEGDSGSAVLETDKNGSLKVVLKKATDADAVFNKESEHKILDQSDEEFLSSVLGDQPALAPKKTKKVTGKKPAVAVKKNKKKTNRKNK